MFFIQTMTECNRTMMIFKTPPVNETNLHKKWIEWLISFTAECPRGIQLWNTVSYYLGMWFKLNMIVRYKVNDRFQIEKLNQISKRLNISWKMSLGVNFGVYSFYIIRSECLNARIQNRLNQGHILYKPGKGCGWVW